MKSGENERSCAHAGAGTVLRETGGRKIMTRVLYKGLQDNEMQTRKSSASQTPTLYDEI